MSYAFKVKNEHGDWVKIPVVYNSEVDVNEADRAAAESKRVIAENGRVTTEALRVKEEEERAKAEQERAKAEERRVAFWDDKSAVYVGTGEMPEGVSVQIDPSGNATAVFSEIAQTTGNSESAVMSQKAATDAIRTVEAIAKGRSSGYVFDTVSDMELWCSESFPFVEYYSRSPYVGALEGPKVAIVVPDSDFYVPYGDWNVNEPICYVESTRKFYNTTYDGKNVVLVEMPEQPKEWQYKLIEVVAPPRLGDNLYIRDTGVPDYWWDGSEPQVLETQFVDVDQYVKKSDYEADIGDIETALDSIIDIQNSLIGGDSV